MPRLPGKRCIPVLLFLLLTPAPAAAQIAHVPPRDEAGADASFLAFQAQLAVAAAKRDSGTVLQVLARDLYDFGGISFAERFRDPEDPVWTDLLTALALGVVLDGKRAHAPYLEYPEAARELERPLAVGLVVGDSVPVHSEPDCSGSRPLTRLSHQVVVWHDQAARDCTRIELADGRSGYVRAGAIVSPLMCRFDFRKRSGRWRIVDVVCGD